MWRCGADMASDITPEKLVDTYRKVAIYHSGLEALATKYQTEDKKRAALVGVDLTIRFLRRLNVDRRLTAALIEAKLIIERNIDGGRTEKKQQIERDVVDCVALELQIRCKVSVDDALKAIVGNDREAADHLETFRKRIRRGKGRNVAARAQFDRFMKLAEGLPPQVAVERALRAAASLRGKKVQKAR